MTASGPSGTYVDHVLDGWSREDDREAFVHGARRVTRAEARRRLLRLANALLGHGVRPGDAVGLFLSNRPESVLAQLAVHLLGCRAVLVRPVGTGELAAHLRLTTPVAIVFDDVHEHRVAELAELGACPPVLLGLGPTRLGADLLDAAAACPARWPERHDPAAGVPAGEPVTVLYTGGTTGRPKLVAHTRVVYDLMAGMVGRASPPGTRSLLARQVTFVAGHSMSVAGALGGWTQVVLDGFEVERVLAVLRDERITTAGLVPPMVAELLDHPDCRAGSLPALRALSIGGAATPPHLLRRAVERFGPVVSTVYALTECLNIARLDAAALAGADDRVWGSCGRPLPGVELEVRDPAGAVLPTGGTGEVFVRSPLVMAGYLGDAEATAEVLRDGRLATGDVGRLDPDGFLHLVDRVKDVVVTGRTSSNVYTRLLEDVLVGLPGVRAAAAVGVPDERFGEAVHVFLVAEPGRAPDLAVVRAEAAARLGPLYEPRYSSTLDSLPLTGGGKVDKRELRRLAASRVPAGAAFTTDD
ncbi:class I adenylate-forming enzyme family protein [Saccharothrix xinjiangensis]|uniref:Class I adenylate-forming enzyme family protein n=1 Tax=Saccharothrix xinjiangensis TaxID=204798 RepID=A0ABV9XZI4_9PSEU